MLFDMSLLEIDVIWKSLFGSFLEAVHVIRAHGFTKCRLMLWKNAGFGESCLKGVWGGFLGRRFVWCRLTAFTKYVLVLSKGVSCRELFERVCLRLLGCLQGNAWWLTYVLLTCVYMGLCRRIFTKLKLVCNVSCGDSRLGLCSGCFRSY